MTWSIRPARDTDAAGLIALIGAVFAEYPGCVLDVDGELPELHRIASYFHVHGGRFWVAERGDAIVGSIGFTPSPEPETIELKKLYVAAAERKTGLGGKLLSLVEDAARERRACCITLWSDTRFTTAHAFYEKRGYLRGPVTRELHDLSFTVEYCYSKRL